MSVAQEKCIKRGGCSCSECKLLEKQLYFVADKRSPLGVFQQRLGSSDQIKERLVWLVSGQKMKEHDMELFLTRSVIADNVPALIFFLDIGCSPFDGDFLKNSHLYTSHRCLSAVASKFKFTVKRVPLLQYLLDEEMNAPDVDTVRLLVEVHGYPLHFSSANENAGNHAVFFAAGMRNGDRAGIIEYLLSYADSHGVRIDLDASYDGPYTNTTAMGLACQNRDRKCIEILHKHGATIDGSNRMVNHHFRMSVTDGEDLDAVALLLQLQPLLAASFNHEDFHSAVHDDLDESPHVLRRDTPLHMAIEHYSSIDMVRLLAEAYPRASMVYDKDGCLPLHTAVYGGYTKVVRLLAQQSPRTIAMPCLLVKQSPLQLAIDNGQPLSLIREMLPYVREACPRISNDDAEADAGRDFGLWPVDLHNNSLLHSLYACGDVDMFVEVFMALFGQPHATNLEKMLEARNADGHRPADLASGELLIAKENVLADRHAAVEITVAVSQYLLPDVAAYVVSHLCLFDHPDLAQEATARMCIEAEHAALRERLQLSINVYQRSFDRLYQNGQRCGEFGFDEPAAKRSRSS